MARIGSSGRTSTTWTNATEITDQSASDIILSDASAADQSTSGVTITATFDGQEDFSMAGVVVE